MNRKLEARPRPHALQLEQSSYNKQNRDQYQVETQFLTEGNQRSDIIDFHENLVFILKSVTSFCIQHIYCNLTDAKQTHTVLVKHSESNQTLYRTPVISETYRHISNNFDDVKTCMKIS
jgi:hypothetical protein